MAERKNITRNARRPKVSEQPFSSMKNSHRNWEQARKEEELKKIQPCLKLS
jgi:hypothetical protein